jgi:hypothetical protein
MIVSDSAKVSDQGGVVFIFTEQADALEETRGKRLA